MERVYSLIHAADFNFALTNLLIDLYSSGYQKHFASLDFDEQNIDSISREEQEKLTKVAAVVEYIGNRKPDAVLYNWVYSARLKLDVAYTPGVEPESSARVKRIITAPKEFACRNVFYNEETLKPV